MNDTLYYQPDNPADEKILKNLRRIAWWMMAPFLFLIGAEVFYLVSWQQLIMPSAILGMSGGWAMIGVTGVVIELFIMAVFLFMAVGGLLLMRRKKAALPYLRILFSATKVLTVFAIVWLIYSALAAFLFFTWPAFFGMAVLFILTEGGDRKLREYIERPEVQQLLS